MPAEAPPPGDDNVNDAEAAAYARARLLLALVERLEEAVSSGAAGVGGGHQEAGGGVTADASPGRRKEQPFCRQSPDSVGAVSTAALLPPSVCEAGATGTSSATGASGVPPPPPPLWLPRPAECVLSVLDTWRALLLARIAAIDTRLPPESYPVGPLWLRGRSRSSLERLWAVVLAEEEGDDGAVGASPLWPLYGAVPPRPPSPPPPPSGGTGGGTGGRAAGPPPPPRARLSAPVTLLRRKGEFVRAVCANSLNPLQLAYALSRGVHQIELAAEVDLSTAAGAGAPPLPPSAMQLSCTAPGVVARCLCSHPRLPLYLAGSDGVVQCWQFGQSVQGLGLHDHLRAQYALPVGTASGHHATSVRFSPCGELFGCIDTTGRVGLWRLGGARPDSLERAPPYAQMRDRSVRGSRARLRTVKPPSRI